MTHPTILLCMGTRPEIIKMVPVVVALRARGADVQILHTGQHTSMADPLYDFFAMRPQHVLLLERQKNDLAELSAQLIERIAPVLQQVKPAAVLVHGDTSSALMAALAAFYEKIPIGHVEAGLRTHAKYDPFPEEKNRELIGRLAHWHFCPTPRAAHNLQTEGLTERIIVTGNTVIDAALQTIKSIQRPTVGLSAEVDGLRQQWQTEVAGGNPCRMVLVTAHRRENWGPPIAAIALSMLNWLAQDESHRVVWPVHANPAVGGVVRRTLAGVSPALAQRFHCLPPVEYPELVWLLSQAWLVATDSGGIQEEATAFMTPVLVLRATTERPEILECGLGKLVGTDPQAINAALSLAQKKAVLPVSLRQNPFGDGHAGERIADRLLGDLHASAASASV
ncbi:MAG: non-hydrolyzing UDP-N-acetylglucosamine 2-epimerase [Burkholderiaceae bacterium]